MEFFDNWDPTPIKDATPGLQPFVADGHTLEPLSSETREQPPGARLVRTRDDEILKGVRDDETEEGWSIGDK